MKHKSLEMKYLVSCVTLNLLFLASIVSSETIQDTTKYEVAELKDQKIQFFDIKTTFHLSCNLTESKGEVIWKKDGQHIDKIAAMKDRVKLNNKPENSFKLTVEKSLADDAGNYSCVHVVDSVEKDSIEFIVSSKPAVRVQANINVVEGEKLYIHCTVLGKPTPIISWTVGNVTYEETADRVQLLTDPESGVPNSILIIEDAKLSDRNEYTCKARSNFTTAVDTESKSMIRIKDKLAALWPFLGICAEVLVLCAVILVYEKKRNKTELEESDTDQSPDQKNTADHGKDSDVRHRK